MDWKLSKYAQLNSHKAQDMFEKPIPGPPNCNILPLLGTYLIKNDGMKKTLCVCNESPYKKGSVALDHTYATALE